MTIAHFAGTVRDIFVLPTPDLGAASEWNIEPDVVRFEAIVGNKIRQAFNIQVSRDRRPGSPRFAVAADVMCDGKYLDQITEGMVDVGA